jgi:hypothetical protein
VKSNHKFIDSPEFDEFFRRGDEPAPAADSLQPMIDFGNGEESDRERLRTPAQRERRAKFIRLVSVTMAFLSVGSAGAFTYKAMHLRTQKLAFVDALAAQPAVQPPAIRASDPTLPASPEIGNGALPIAQPPTTAAEPAAPTPPATQPLHGAAAASTSTAAKAIEPPDKGSRRTASTPSARKPIVPAAPAPTRSAVVRSTPIASPAAALAVRTRSPVPSHAAAKTAGVRPENYHPPTASFSD